MEPLIIEMNIETVNALTKQGKLAIYGDVSREEVLKAAGIDKTQCLIITIPNAISAAAAAVAAKNINNNLHIFARSRFLYDRKVLQKAGATHIVFEEEAVAASLAKTITDYCLNNQSRNASIL